MKGDLTIRKTKTASGATAVQVVRYEGKRCIVEKHIGSAHDQPTFAALMTAAQCYLETHRKQPDLFASIVPSTIPIEHAQLTGVTHRFARDSLHHCLRLCGIRDLPEIYIDLALMRIIEPASKLRTIELIHRYFGIRYAQRTVYRLLPKILAYRERIEDAAIKTALNDLKETFSLVLYDVTTLYFESFKEYDFQQPGFSKDNKPQQPQIVIGLLTTRSGFPVMHEVFEGNTFEGHTMLRVVHRFQKRFEGVKPIIVADAAMLSQENMRTLNEEGYRYIVGARLANTTSHFIEKISTSLPRTDKAHQRFEYARNQKERYTIICEFSVARYKKDKREFEKQVKRAQELIQRKEPGRRAKFVRKSHTTGRLYEFNDALKEKAEKLLGIKGYVTNIPEKDMTNAEVMGYYHDLWHVEQAFRMSKSDLKARPIFHCTQDSIKAHLLICFVALMMGKYLEIKTGLSIRKIRDQLWEIQEAHVVNRLTGEKYVLKTAETPLLDGNLLEILKNSH